MMPLVLLLVFLQNRLVASVQPDLPTSKLGRTGLEKPTPEVTHGRVLEGGDEQIWVMQTALNNPYSGVYQRIRSPKCAADHYWQKMVSE